MRSNSPLPVAVALVDADACNQAVASIVPEFDYSKIGVLQIGDFAARRGGNQRLQVQRRRFGPTLRPSKAKKRGTFIQSTGWPTMVSDSAGTRKAQQQSDRSVFT